MVSGVQEGNSSSQNVNFTIQNIRYIRQHKCLIEFLEGETVTLDKTLTIEEGFFKGQVLSYSQIQDMTVRSALREAERTSIKLISQYLHSQTALRIKLIKKGFSQAVIEQVIVKLTEAGFLNDAEFARAWLQARLEKHPEGKRILFAGLKSRGISNSIAREAIAEVFTPEREEQCIRNLIIRKNSWISPDEEELRKFLLKRGFERNMVFRVLESLEC